LALHRLFERNAHDERVLTATRKNLPYEPACGNRATVRKNHFYKSSTVEVGLASGKDDEMIDCNAYANRFADGVVVMTGHQRQYAAATCELQRI